MGHAYVPVTSAQAKSPRSPGLTVDRGPQRWGALDALDEVLCFGILTRHRACPSLAPLDRPRHATQAAGHRSTIGPCD